MSTKAFIRVSTILQNTEKNKIDILQFANRMKLGNVDFIEEHASGSKNYKERKLGALLDSMISGDALISNYAQLRNKDKLGILDNTNRLLYKNADIQLYTAKTGSFDLSLW